MKKYKCAKQIRKKGCPYYEELEIIYSGSSATSFSSMGNVETPSEEENDQIPLTQELIGNNSLNDIQTPYASTLDTPKGDIDIEIQPTTNMLTRRGSLPSSLKKGKRAKQGGDLMPTMEIWYEISKRRMSMIEFQMERQIRKDKEMEERSKENPISKSMEVVNEFLMMGVINVGQILKAAQAFKDEYGGSSILRALLVFTLGELAKQYDCIGAINGTHMSAWVHREEQIPYRGRKSRCTTKVLAVCSFDMQFTFVHVDWEGSAHDSRVGHQRFRSKKELFNYKHFSVRNIIERCFGILKGKFLILQNMPSFDLRMQCYIVMACFITYNFIKRETIHDKDIDTWSREDMTVRDEGENYDDDTDDDSEQMDFRPTNVSDNIVDRMWEQYQLYRSYA
ncbi:PREDICTED: uncharacterized protein LOC104587731 [Nelumbo nucifera]|uniref:Uncharacterized protein LOC104587731 n=1 Tax=Nelumbo nucifera TaxID=4432 RepID=A0A1U7YZT7_NELNU|nr:PREDICTED: uncharacterized protein LOC104587731 [Nelumbo nucifera]